MISHTEYTETLIFLRKPIKGENFFFLGCQSSPTFMYITVFELRLKYEATTSYRKIQNVEISNSQISLAPTRWKHQLLGFSSTH